MSVAQFKFTKVIIAVLALSAVAQAAGQSPNDLKSHSRVLATCDVSYCKTCGTGYNYGYCTECEEGYTKYGEYSSSCYECGVTNCATCSYTDMSSGCLTCKAGYSLDDSTWLNKCISTKTGSHTIVLIVVLVVYGVVLLIAILITCRAHSVMDAEAKKYTGGASGNATMPMYQGGAMMGNTPSYAPALMANPQPYQPMYGAKATDLPPGFAN